MSSRIVGTRELHVYETDPSCATGVYAVPLVTRWYDPPCRQFGIDPLAVSGTVVDIGSGDDILGLELVKAGSTANIHRVNPALGPNAPIEIMFAMTEARHLRASRMGVDAEVMRNWGISYGVFPDDIDDIPHADWLFSLFCYPTTLYERGQRGAQTIKERRTALGKGLDAIGHIANEGAEIVLGPVRSDEPLSELKKAISKQRSMRKKKQREITGRGSTVLRLSQ